MEIERSALAGLKVLELSHSVPAAYCGRQFALWGADVVVVEPEHGSPLRAMSPRVRGASGAQHSLLWAYVAASKRTLLRSALSRPAVFHDLLAGTDLLIVDRDEDGLAELGMSWAALRERHPRLCVISLTAFGLSGPYRAFRGSDLIVQALSGYLTLNGLPTMPPLQAPGQILAYAVGVNAFVGGLAAYLKRERTGFGDLVEVSALESLATIVPFLRVQYMRDDKVREGGCEPGVRILPCSDGWVSLSVPADGSQKELYRDVVGIPLDAWPERVPSTLLARVEALRAFMSRYTRQKTADHIFHGLERRGVTCGKLISPRGLLENEQLLAREFFVPVRHPDLGVLPYPGPAGKLRASAALAPSPAPELSAAIEPAQLGWAARAVLASGAPGTPGAPSTPDAPGTPGRRAELPLAGLSVIDLTQAWIGPFATLMLADLGADVVKIESHKRPDVWRQPSPLPVAIKNIHAERVNRSHYFNSVNRNKRSLTLDLTTPDGLELFRSLARTADVIAENFSSGVMARFGLDHDALAALRRELVMVSSSGFGKTGPWAGYRSNGAAIETLAGWDALHAYRDGDPLLMGFYQADAISGFQLAALILVCLVRRLRTGSGESVDAAMLEAASGYIGESILEAHLVGELMAHGNRHPDQAPHGVFPCKGHDRWIAIAVPDDATWQALLGVPGCPPALRSPELTVLGQRLERQDGIEAQLRHWTATREADALMMQLQAAGVPAGVVRGALEGVDEPQLTARDWFKSMTHPDVGTHKYNGFPWRFADCELIAHTPPPRLGEHADLLLHALLGLCPEQIEALKAKGVTGAVL